MTGRSRPQSGIGRPVLNAANECVRDLLDFPSGQCVVTTVLPCLGPRHMYSRIRCWTCAPSPDAPVCLTPNWLRKCPGHALHGIAWTVIAEVIPQDEVVVEAGHAAYLIHLTGTGRAEVPPWPVAERFDSAEDFERLVEFRY